MARVIEQVFDSPEAMAQTAGRLTALPWPDWSARMRSLEFDGVRADYVEIDPYELEIAPLQDRVDKATRMMLSIVLQGSSTGSVADHTVQLSSKQAALLDGRAAMRFRALAPVRAVRLFVDESELSPHALQCPNLPFALLRHTPLVTGCIGLITGLLQINTPNIEPCDEVAVSQPLIALMGGLLDQALLAPDAFGRQVATQRAPQLRRGQIEEYIGRHLADRDLTPVTIADALGVHIRTVHNAYRDQPETVSKRIRTRRILRAQTLLAANDRAPDIATLAAAVGLTPLQLTRSFQLATNRTARQWWQDHHHPKV